MTQDLWIASMKALAKTSTPDSTDFEDMTREWMDDATVNLVDVVVLLIAGKKMEAIKKYKFQSGEKLIDAKVFVEGLMVKLVSKSIE